MVFLSLAGGVVLLYLGAEGLIRGGASLALRLGLTPLLVGLTVVAFGTSMPELVVSVGAALGAHGDIAVGNAVGSNIANVLLILGVASVIRPLRVQSQLIRLDVPIAIGVSLLLTFFLMNDRALSRIEGAVLVLGLVLYTAMSVVVARREKAAVQAGFVGELPPLKPAWQSVLFLFGGLGLLIYGANLFVGAAVTLATGFGVPEAVIGLTVVAIGTSLPELATSVVASAKGDGDISIGNVVGSNIFNVLGILGIAALVRPFEIEAVRPFDLLTMVAVGVLLLPLLRSGFRLSRVEGVGLLLLYAAYIASLLFAGSTAPVVATL